MSMKSFVVVFVYLFWLVEVWFVFLLLGAFYVFCSAFLRKNCMLFYFMFMVLLHTCIIMNHKYARCIRRPEVPSSGFIDNDEPPLVAGNQAWVLWKSNKGS